MLTERVMLRALASNRLDTGRGYHLEGRVRHLRFSPGDGRIEAEVVGTRQQILHVVVLIGNASTGVTIDGTCTCLVRHNCAHVAATLYEALDISTTGRIRAHSDSSDEAIEQWMHELGAAAELAPTAAPPLGAHLAYVVDVREMMFRREVTVQSFLIAESRDGVAAVQPFRLHHLSKSSSAHTTQEDRDIGRLLEFSGLIPGQNGRTSAHVALDLLLRMLCATGRAHWRTREAPPLRLGDPIASEFSWRADADGRARPSVADDGLILLPTDPPWYVDPVRNVAGVIDIGVPTAVAGTLAAAPALSARQAERARALWNGPLAHMQPSHSGVASVEEALAPVPVAILRGGRTSAFAPASSALRPTLDLRFDYGGSLIEATDPSGEVRVGDRSHRRRRDIEAAAVARLREIGFHEHLFSAQDGSGRTLFAYAFEADEEYRWGRMIDIDLDMLRSQGWRVEIDPSFSLDVVHAEGVWESDLSQNGNRWFEFDLGVDVAGKRVSLLPIILEAIRRAGPGSLDEPLYGQLPDGRFLALPPQRLAFVLSTLVELNDGETKLTRDGRLELSPAQAATLADVDGELTVRWNGAGRLHEFFRSTWQNEPLELPAWFGATLRPYQRDGVAWLQRLARYGFGGILADDMGLGKTVQLLAHVSIEKEAGRLRAPCLVVAPTSVVPNWLSETARFAPNLRVLVHAGAGRAENVDLIENADIVLTSYPLLVRDAGELLSREWSIAVLDEAQMIKNPASKGAKTAQLLDAQQRIALTGTPIENHLEELWSLAAFCVPGMLGDRRTFRRVFRAPIERRGDLDRRSLLARRLAPFLVRRTKGEVEAELPEKTEIVQRVEFGQAQRDLYETIRLAMHERVRRELANRGVARSRIVVLDALLKLRQACCDPRLVKVAAAKSVEGSAKLEALVEMLPSLIDDGRRILLFSQFTSMLDLIVPELEQRSIPFVQLRGTTKDRTTPVERFQRGEVPLFLISLKAGGTGLNLTNADTVIHYDVWWNPAVENQATDRAHRIGQEQHVFVYKLIVAGSVEERILDLQQRKSALASGLFTDGATTVNALDAADIEHLFAPLDAYERAGSLPV